MAILFLAVLAFIVWHFLPQGDPNKPSPRYRQRATDTDCESPAEDAFLRAVTAIYDLKPMGRSFVGKGLRLDLQVEEGPYRVDFLANEWLVIEIDGAAYHSSPEAVRRDKVRDEYFESIGYTVIRIPAKAVFNTPRDAVQRVRTALHKGRQPQPTPVKKTGWQRLSETMSSINDGLSAISESMDRKLAEDRALAEANSIFELEQITILSAMKSAKAEQEISARCENDAAFAKHYAESYARYATLIAGQLESSDGSGEEKSLEIKPFPQVPLLSGNPDHDAAIHRQFAQIVEARSNFLLEQRATLANDIKLQGLFGSELKRRKCPDYWGLLHKHYRAPNGKLAYGAIFPEHGRVMGPQELREPNPKP